MKIYIDTEEIKNKANSIKNLADELQDNMKNIEKLILDLGLEWQGRAELAYTAKILYVKKQFSFMYDLINDYSVTLKAVANEYNELENTIKRQLEV